MQRQLEEEKILIMSSDVHNTMRVCKVGISACSDGCSLDHDF